MQVTAGTKNPFRIHFPKTLADGTTSMTAQDFRGQFNDHFDQGIMDYDGSIENANDIMRVNLFDLRPIMRLQKELSCWPLFTHERTVWKSRKERVDYLLSCRNQEFYFFEQTAVIPEDATLRLTVGKKLGAGSKKRYSTLPLDKV